ncbi:MAG: hypothetical protein WBQ89_24645, partial [Candidatus Acidiferrum sp.]
PEAVARFKSVLIVIDDSIEEWSFMASSLSAEQVLVPPREKTGTSLGWPSSARSSCVFRPSESAG